MFETVHSFSALSQEFNFQPLNKTITFSMLSFTTTEKGNVLSVFRAYMAYSAVPNTILRKCCFLYHIILTSIWPWLVSVPKLLTHMSQNPTLMLPFRKTISKIFISVKFYCQYFCHVSRLSQTGGISLDWKMLKKTKKWYFLMLIWEARYLKNPCKHNESQDNV